MKRFRKVIPNWDTKTNNGYLSTQEAELPEVVEVPMSVPYNEIEDWLSDNYHFCVFGFVEVGS